LVISYRLSKEEARLRSLKLELDVCSLAVVNSHAGRVESPEKGVVEKEKEKARPLHAGSRNHAEIPPMQMQFAEREGRRKKPPGRRLCW